MSISSKHITVHTWPDSVLVTIPTKQLESFKELVNRGANCWDKAPAGIKEFADILMNGHSLQDYHNISDPKPRPDQ